MPKFTDIEKVNLALTREPIPTPEMLRFSLSKLSANDPRVPKREEQLAKAIRKRKVWKKTEKRRLQNYKTEIKKR